MDKTPYAGLFSHTVEIPPQFYYSSLNELLGPGISLPSPLS